MRHLGTIFLGGPQGLVPSISGIISPALIPQDVYWSQKQRFYMDCFGSEFSALTVQYKSKEAMQTHSKIVCRDWHSVFFTQGFSTAPAEPLRSNFDARCKTSFFHLNLVLNYQNNGPNGRGAAIKRLLCRIFHPARNIVKWYF